jgi:DNA-binding transcriptional MerR regulator/methylmalonyl-CoA mutase cobalamin-binding subunit
MPSDQKFPAGQHPIGVAGERTGLSPHVLRVWERRYGAVEPTRTAGGHRVYSDADIERLRLLARVTAAKRSISLVAHLPADELARLAREDEEARRRAGISDGPAADRAAVADDVGEARALARSLDALGLERALRRSLALMGVPAFLETVATALVRRIGEDRREGRLAAGAENLVAVTLRRVLEGIIPVLHVSSDAPNLLLATPAGDRHEIEAVMAAATAAAEGWCVTYLGPGVPASEIAAAAMNASARAVGVTVPRVGSHDLLLGELRALQLRLSPGVPLLVGGTGARPLAVELRRAGIHVIENLADLRAVLQIAGRSEAA